MNCIDDAEQIIKNNWNNYMNTHQDISNKKEKQKNSQKVTEIHSIK